MHADSLALADSKTGPRKVPLNAKAKRILAHQPRGESPFVFPSPQENAKALLRVANHLDAATDKEPTESLLFHGLIIVVPTLLGLAAKLALNALYIREQRTSPKSHDLLELFERLPAGLRRRLEQKMPSVPRVHPDLPSVFPGIREVLAANRTLFVEWRYLHERHGALAETSKY